MTHDLATGLVYVESSPGVATASFREYEALRVVIDYGPKGEIVGYEITLPEDEPEVEPVKAEKVTDPSTEEAKRLKRQAAWKAWSEKNKDKLRAYRKAKYYKDKEAKDEAVPQVRPLSEGEDSGLDEAEAEE